MTYRLAFVFGSMLMLLALVSHTRADECRPIETVLAEVFDRAKGAELRRETLTLPQLDFARGIYAGAPPAGGYPPDGHATLIRLPNDDAALMFHSDNRSCGMIWIPAALTKAVRDFGAREQAP